MYGQSALTFSTCKVPELTRALVQVSPLPDRVRVPLPPARKVPVVVTGAVMVAAP